MTKQIQLDSLLQEVCIRSRSDLTNDSVVTLDVSTKMEYNYGKDNVWCVIFVCEKRFWHSHSHSLSLQMTKQIQLDSLLQEVCIRSGLAGRSPSSSLRLSVCLVSHKPSLFRAKESPLNNTNIKDKMYHTVWQAIVYLTYMQRIINMLTVTELLSSLTVPSKSLVVFVKLKC